MKNSTRVLHISDIHEGYRFNVALWDDLFAQVKALNPDLIVITGDMVNTPWRGTVKRASHRIRRFRDELRLALNKPDLSCVLVPGNHDTRVTGLIPVARLLPFAFLGATFTLVFFVASLFFVSIWATVFDGMACVSGALALVALLLRAAVTVRLNRAFGDDIFIEDPTPFSELNIGIIPFDSASRGVNWARGYIDPRQFSNCRKVDDHPTLTWIAAVHHHPLLLPYDSAHESMMVMDNAGAFLRELGTYGIKLVLHGHKHHQHFARIFVDPARGQSLDVCVLSAGTPTEGRAAGSWRHGFNVIDVMPVGRCEIEMFEAEPGGTFHSARRFDMQPSSTYKEQRFQRNKASSELSCRESNWSVVIDASGDSKMAHELIGMVAARSSVTTVAGAVDLRTQTGCFERLVANTIGSGGPGIMLTPLVSPATAVAATAPAPVSAAAIPEATLRDHCRANLTFKGDLGLHPEHGAIDVSISVYANNAFALNRREYRQMYRNDSDDVESLLLRTLPHVAVGALNALVRFAGDIGLPRRIDFSVRDGDGAHWTPLPPNSVTRIQNQGAVLVHVSYPIPGAQYRLSWDVDDEASALSLAEEQQVSRADALAARLVSVNDADTRQKILNEIEVWRSEAESDAEGNLGDGPYHVALYAYAKGDGQLKLIASNYEADDVRNGWRYHFGDGLVGRAYRTRKVTAFRKSALTADSRSLGYQRGDGVRVDRASDIPEATALALPVAFEGLEDWPYAVLLLSTDDPEVALRTEDDDDAQPIDELLKSMNKLLSHQLKACFGSPANAE